MIVHTNSLKNWNVFDDDSVFLLESIILIKRFCLDLAENEELVLLLLVHDQILTTDDANPIFVL